MLIPLTTSQKTRSHTPITHRSHPLCSCVIGTKGEEYSGCEGTAEQASLFFLFPPNFRLTPYTDSNQNVPVSSIHSDKSTKIVTRLIYSPVFWTESTLHCFLLLLPPPLKTHPFKQMHGPSKPNPQPFRRRIRNRQSRCQPSSCRIRSSAITLASEYVV